MLHVSTYFWNLQFLINVCFSLLELSIKLLKQKGPGFLRCDNKISYIIFPYPLWYFDNVKNYDWK